MRAPWHIQIFRRDMTVPSFDGQLHDFAAVEAAVNANADPLTIIRVIGPDDATSDELRHLREIGGSPTWPPLAGK